MLPDLSIAGSGALPVRGDHAWTSSMSPSSSISSVDTNTLLSPLEESSSSSESEFSSFSSESADSSEDESTDLRPPSPPVKTLVLGAVPSPSSASSLESVGDYFSAAKTSPAPKSFLSRVFPRSKLIDRAQAVKSVTHWQLALFDEGLPESTRTLYARGAFEAMNLRENLVELLDHADEALDCDAVVVVLDKKDPNLASILHSLMYVGGVVVPANAASVHKKHSSKYVLVGIDL